MLKPTETDVKAAAAALTHTAADRIAAGADAVCVVHALVEALAIDEHLLPAGARMVLRQLAAHPALDCATCVKVETDPVFGVLAELHAEYRIRRTRQPALPLGVTGTELYAERLARVDRRYIQLVEHDAVTLNDSLGRLVATALAATNPAAQRSALLAAAAVVLLWIAELDRCPISHPAADTTGQARRATTTTASDGDFR